MQETQVLETVVMLQEYYQKSLSAGQLTIYEQALARLEPAELHQAALAWVADPERGQFFPRVNELVRMAQENQRQARAQIESRRGTVLAAGVLDQAAWAWTEKVSRAWMEHGEACQCETCSAEPAWAVEYAQAA